jgi:hypothetical protein
MEPDNKHNKGIGLLAFSIVTRKSRYRGRVPGEERSPAW